MPHAGHDSKQPCAGSIPRLCPQSPAPKYFPRSARQTWQLVLIAWLAITEFADSGAWLRPTTCAWLACVHIMNSAKLPLGRRPKRSWVSRTQRATMVLIAEPQIVVCVIHPTTGPVDPVDAGGWATWGSWPSDKDATWKPGQPHCLPADAPLNKLLLPMLIARRPIGVGLEGPRD